MNFSKEQLKQISIILLAGIIGFILGRYTAKPALKISAQVPDVSNEIAKSFGWAKAPGNIQVEPVNIIRGAIEAQNSNYLMPAVKLAIKNVGKDNLPSFGIDYSFLDIDNNKKLGSYAVASGTIQLNWTSQDHTFSLSSDNWKEITGNAPITFRVAVSISIRTENGSVKEIYKTTFEPNELPSLPKIK